jgi:hypothetical protein
MMRNIYEFCENQGSKDHIFLGVNEIAVMHVVWNVWHLESREYLGTYVHYTIEHAICRHVKYLEG